MWTRRAEFDYGDLKELKLWNQFYGFSCSTLLETFWSPLLLTQTYQHIYAFRNTQYCLYTHEIMFTTCGI